MKKIIFIVSLSFLIAACSGDEKKTISEKENGAINEKITDSQAEEVEASVSENETFNLAYRMEEGRSAKYKLTSVAITNQSIESRDSNIVNEVKQTTEYIIDIGVNKSNADGMNLDINISSVKITANFNNDILEFNSEDDNTAEALKKFPEYAALANNTFGLIINRHGRIVDVISIESIISKYLEIQEVPSIKEEERTQLRNQLKDQALQPLSQQLFKYLPAEEFKMDSTWNLSYPSEMGIFDLQNNAVSTLNKILDDDGNKIAKITTTLEVDVTGDGTVQRGDVTFKFDMPEISGTAETYFDLNRGIVKSSKTSTETRTFVVINAAKPGVGAESAQRTDLTVNNNYLELLEYN